jgi:DNA-binding transcriptional LysR family regulator
MKLTEDGERCFERAKELLANLQAFDADMRGTGDQPEGTLRVVVPHAFGQQQLIGPLSSYLERYPGVAVEWLLNDREPDFIASGIDCAIHVGEVSDPTAVAIRLAEVRRIVIAAPSLTESLQSAHPSDIAALPWLAMRTFYRDTVTLVHTRSGERVQLPIRPRISTDSLYALRSAACLGLGVGVISAWMAAGDMAQGRLVHLVPEWEAEALPIYLVYPHARFYSSRLRRFIEVMRETVPAVMNQD